MFGQLPPILWRLAHAARPHWLFIIAAPIAIIVMTQPSLALVADVDTARVPTGPTDIFMKYWDAWYGEEMLAGRADFFHTDLLFHPNELSLAFHNFSLSHMLVFGSLQKLLPPVNAYVLTYLLIIVANLLAAYVFLLRLVSRPAVACAGAFVFGMSTFVLKHQEHPDMALIATIPLTLYGLERAARDGQWRWRFFAGIAAGFTAFIGMYIFICLLMTLGIYTLYLGLTRWRDARFWQMALVLLLVAGAISMARLYPMLADRALLGEALDKKSGAERHNDLLMLFVNTDHPLLESVKTQLFAGRKLWAYADGYLGYLPIAVVSLCLLGSRRRRELLPWLVIAALFIVLRLGSVLTIGGMKYTGIPMPKYVLDRLLPWVFEAVWNISNFQIGILLPWAALFCLSLDWLLRKASARKLAAAVVVVLLVICFENYSETTWSYSIDPERLDWIAWLESEDDFEDLQLIHLPMGRNQSKQYGYFQTFNRIPHAEGLASRTPSQAYATINSNLLLSAWQGGDSLQCVSENREAYLDAVNELRELGFTHIVHHRQQLGTLRVFDSFSHVPAAFDDRFVTIFLVDDLHFACDWQESLATASQAQKRLLADYPALRSASDLRTITIHSESLVTMNALHSPMRIDLAAPARRAHAEKLLVDRAGALLQSSLQPDDLSPAYRDWLADEFELCDMLSDDGEWRIDVFLRSGLPCDLLFLQPLRVDYDNGLRMSNLVLHVDGRKLNLYFLWRAFPDDRHSFSLQLVDEAGERALGFDKVIYDDEFVHHQVDLASLPPGGYRAKLIVYHFETRASIPGVIADNQTPFQREVDVGSITLD